MQNGPIPTATPDPLSVDAAFVVHLTATEAGPERVCGRVEHITSGQSTRFASAADLLTFMRQIITSMVLLMALAIPAWSDDTCLTGSDPEVQGDAAAIGAVRGGIDTTCPCASFDGTTGHTHSDYLRCVKRELDDALDAGDLRAECKSRIKRAFRQSTCGRKPHLQAAPCIHTTTGGEIRCAVRPAAACQSKPGRYARVACPDSVTCVDAGDGNADYLIDRLDSGACVPTPSPTPTATPIDTATATPIDTATATPTATPTVTATVCTASGPIVPRVDVNEDDDPQIVVLPPDPAANQCDPQTLLGGGCEINGLDGTIPNTFDAGATIDGARCPGDSPPSFRWEIFRPPGLGGTPYSAAGIIGYYGPLLTILPNSFPSLEATEAAGDPNWRVLLSIQSNVFPFHSTQKWFKFEFTSSSLTLQMSTDCQRIGHIQGEECTIEASNGLPSTEVPPLEPGWTVCASEGGTCSFSGPRTVRYGAYAPYALLNVNGPISCTTAAFGSDPAPDQAKHCEYYGAP